MYHLFTFIDFSSFAVSIPSLTSEYMNKIIYTTYSYPNNNPPSAEKAAQSTTYGEEKRPLKPAGYRI